MADRIITSDDVFEIAGYMKDVILRAKELGETADKMDKVLSDFDDVFFQKKINLSHGMNDLNERLSEIKDEVRFMQKNTLSVIGSLKNSVKKEDFKRIESKVDSWAPEKMINHAEAGRIIDKSEQ
jgi:hypothetical protein